MRRKKGAKKQGSSVKSLLLRQTFSITTLFVLSIIFAFILSALKNPLGSMKLASLLALLSCGAISGIVIARRSGEGGVKAALISAVIFSLIILAVALIATGGRVGGVHFMNSVCYILVSGISALLFGHKKAKRHRR